MTFLYDTNLEERTRKMYLELVKRAVLNHIYECKPPFCSDTLVPEEIQKKERFYANAHVNAYSMIGYESMTNLERLATMVLSEGIPGGFMECGIYRGGTLIFLKAILDVYGQFDRQIYGADSFKGLPPVDQNRFPDDSIHDGAENLLPPTFESSKLKVIENFYQFGLKDSRLHLLEGYFNESLPNANNIGSLALLRIDGDLYQSTMEALQYMYPKLSKGGVVIIDDYGDWQGCKKAVDDFRSGNSISSALLKHNGLGTAQVDKIAYWFKDS